MSTTKKKSAETSALAGPVRLGSKINNAPAVTNTGGYELRTAAARTIVAKMAGHNSGGFEGRAIQEQGTH